MNNSLNEDSHVTLLINSNLAITLNDRENFKVYTLKEWNLLVTRLRNSNLKSPKAFFHSTCNDWKINLGLADYEVERLKGLLNNRLQLTTELERLSSRGIWITTRAESTYPALLKSRLKQKCPRFLFCAGNYDLLKTKGIGIVGSRDIDQEALDFTKILSRRCTCDGYTIVSGGAKGVDSVAQSIALQNGGAVICIVSDSMAFKIRIKENSEFIMKNKLLFVSLFNPEITFKAYNALERNKYIYVLSQFTVAVSSDFNKGGTWSGSSENLKNNWVPLLVRKEQNIPIGNNELLRIGALPLKREQIKNNNIPIGNWVNN